MKVLPINDVNYYNQNYKTVQGANFAGFAYKPNNNFSLGNLNPVALYINKLFERSLIASRRRIQSISKNLMPYTKEVNIGKSYAWDINKDDRKKYIIILHGTSQNITNLQTLYNRIISETNYAVLAPEYRGFGKNPPVMINENTFAKDTQAALDYLTETKKIPPENISVLGHSFGGFTASQLVSKNTKLERLILIAGITSLEHETLNFEKGTRRKIPKFIKFLFNHIKLLRKPLTGVLKTGNHLQNTTVPVDIIHSKNDAFVKASSSQKLAEKCKNLEGMYILPSGGHGMDSTKTDIIISILR